MSEPATPATPAVAAAPKAQGSILRAGWLLFAALLLALAIPYHPNTGWNVNSRMALVRAIADEGVLTIDSYHEEGELATGDKAVYEGHYYCDKIIGVSLLGVPFYWVAKAVSGGAPLSIPLGNFIAKLGAVAIPGAVSAFFFWRLMARVGAPPRRALVLTALAVFGTMWFGFGTVFYPYIPGFAALLGALHLIMFPPAERVTAANSLGTGLLLGAALLCDLLFGMAVFGVGVIWLMRLCDQVGILGMRAFAQMTGERSRLKHMIAFSACFWAGVLLALLPFFAYSYHIFGTLTIPYKYEADEGFRYSMAQGFMGAKAPNLHALFFLTLHPYRGIFFWSPIVLAGLIGCAFATRQYGKRALLGWLGIATFVAYLVFNSAYYLWWGGWAMGPRLLLPALPFVLLGLGELARSGKISAFEGHDARALWAWRGTVAVGVVSVLLSMPLSLTEPQIPQGNQHATLAQASIGDDIVVPQWEALRAFYSGGVTLDLRERLSGNIGSDRRGANVALIAIFLGIVGGLLTAAWKAAPEKAGVEALRNDYPFRTVDGTAAPPPPKMG